MAGFGQRNRNDEWQSAVQRQSDFITPSFHESHIELHWPKYVAITAALFAAVYLVQDGKTDLFGLILAPILFGGFSYFAVNKLRTSINAVHTLKKSGKRSPAFKVGLLAGFGYFIYSVFISPTEIMGVEWGAQTAFSDGLQREDFGSVAILLLKCAGLMVVGGMIFETIGKRFFNLETGDR